MPNPKVDQSMFLISPDQIEFGRGYYIHQVLRDTDCPSEQEEAHKMIEKFYLPELKKRLPEVAMWFDPRGGTAFCFN
jgi:hypothetical protein